MATADLYRWTAFGEGLSLDARIVERCAYCEFVVEASFEQARQAFEQHECDRPRPTSTKRREGGFARAPIRSPRDDH